MSFGKAIAIIGGIAVGAVGAYNYSTTGCPLGTGSCGGDDAATLVSAQDGATQTVATDGAAMGDACPLGCSMDKDSAVATLAVSEESSSCCSEESGAAVDAVADAGGSCCSSMSKAAAVLAVAETTTESSESSCCSAEKAAVVEVAEKSADCCGQCGEDGEGECDPAACPGGDACCKTVASIDD